MARELDEAWIGEAIAQYRRIERLRAAYDARVSTIEVAVHSADELVEVRVCADGEIRGVNVVGPLQGRSSGEVSRSVEAAVAAAADAADWARRTLYAEMFGVVPGRGTPPGRDPATRRGPAAGGSPTAAAAS